MFSNDLMKPFLFPTNMFSKSQVLVSCPALRFTFWDGKHFGLNKQVKPGFTNYQPRFSQFFCQIKKLKLAKLASKQRYQIELMRINGY